MDIELSQCNNNSDCIHLNATTSTSTSPTPITQLTDEQKVALAESNKYVSFGYVKHIKHTKDIEGYCFINIKYK